MPKFEAQQGISVILRLLVEGELGSARTGRWPDRLCGAAASPKRPFIPDAEYHRFEVSGADKCALAA